MRLLEARGLLNLSRFANADEVELAYRAHLERLGARASEKDRRTAAQARDICLADLAHQIAADDARRDATAAQERWWEDTEERQDSRFDHDTLYARWDERQRDYTVRFNDGRMLNGWDNILAAYSRWGWELVTVTAEDSSYPGPGAGRGTVLGYRLFWKRPH